MLHNTRVDKRVMFACSNDYDAALVILAGVLDHPAVNLAISETCFDGTGGKCDLQHFRWVRTSSSDQNAGELVKAATTSIYRNVCQTKYARYNVMNVSEMMICSGKLEGSTYICQGDPGDPLILNEEQVGITSWSTGCAGKDKPAVYTSVPKLFPWIQREVESMEEVRTTLEQKGIPFHSDSQLVHVNKVVLELIQF